MVEFSFQIRTALLQKAGTAM
ncbi:hypothetical protein MAR_035700 [Mya arenaria]|uniref:Uncharacterized protein n=1 Tax=Mya arenaria TaxID=6604 RepID=A0ABY7EQE7_MYAAR|nr:hypothetical protein MAR_035700 [Mya arenaria]